MLRLRSKRTSLTGLRLFARIIGWNLGFLAAGLVVLELTFGTWLFGEDWGVLNIVRNQRLRIDTSQLYEGGGEISYTRDYYGLRGRYGTLSEIDMVVLGGGTTNEFYVDDQETWVYRLGDHFRQNGRSFTIVNAGVDSQTVIGHVTMLKKWFPLLPGAKPRFIAAYVGINDMVLGPDDDKQWVDDLTPRKRTKKLRFYIKNHSALFRLYRLVKGWFEAKVANADHGSSTYDDVEWAPAGPVPSPLYQDKDAVDDVLLKRYSHRLVMLIDAIRALGAEPVIITQGTDGYRVREGVIYGVSGGDRPDTGPYEAIAVYNGTAMETCRVNKGICVDLFAELFFDDGDFYDPLHTTPKGSAKIAAYLYDRLRPLVGR